MGQETGFFFLEKEALALECNAKSIKIIIDACLSIVSQHFANQLFFLNFADEA